MNSKTEPLRAAIQTELAGSARCVLVAPDASGELAVHPIAYGASVLNIERDLLKHLNERPHSDEWLAMLRDYCDSRLNARAAANASGCFITPVARFDWDMTPRGASH